MAVFLDAVGPGGAFSSPNISWPVAVAEWNHPGPGLHKTVVVGVSFQVDGQTLSSLGRACSYDGLPMTSLGIAEWGGAGHGAWTELWGIVDVPGGKRIHSEVSGGFFAGRRLRGESLSYTGVDSFGTVVTATGTGTALSVAGTTTAANMIVQAFGTLSGLSAYTATQRHISNDAISLVMGDAVGTGSAITFGATRAASDVWSGLTVVLKASDIVATAKPLAATPVVSASGRRLPRPGITRRTVFNVQPEA
jgi:hypothetical protein